MEATLKNLRNTRKIQQNEAAKLLELSNSHLSEIESGKKSISLKLLRKIITAYKLSNDEIIAFIRNQELELCLVNVLKDKT